jgi:hypothetical protein
MKTTSKYLKYCDMTAERPNSLKRRGGHYRQRRRKHLSEATNQHTTVEELLVSGVFYAVHADAI